MRLWNKMAATLPVVLITISLGLVFVSKFFNFLIFKGTPAGLPNGSMGYLPLFGETLSNLKPHKSNAIGTFLQEHCSRYGNVFKSHLLGRPTIVSCDLELNIFILQNEGKLFQSSYPNPVGEILSKSCILIAKGDLHKKLRSVAVSFFEASKSSPDFLRYVEKMSLSFIDSWKAKQKVFLYKEVKQLTFHVMLKFLLSIEADDPLAEKVHKDFVTMMKGLTSVPLYIPGTAYEKAIKARRRILSTLKEIIKEREYMLSRGDFIDELLANVGLNDEQKVSIVLDLIFGGYETASGLMALVVYFLAQAPSSLRTLQDEHQILRKRKEDGEPLHVEDYKKMKFNSHVLSEALRCGNVIKQLPRKALKDVKFKEYTIPAGWQVLPILSAPHLDPSLHDSPSEFNPWRWDDPAIRRRVSPFGTGLRICPGAEFGKLMTTVFLHHFIFNLRWKTKQEEYPISSPFLEFKRGLELEIE